MFTGSLEVWRQAAATVLVALLLCLVVALMAVLADSAGEWLDGQRAGHLGIKRNWQKEGRE